jgi:uncharacterized protein
MLIMTESPIVLQSEPFYKWNLIEADPDDNKFSDCAVASAADYFVTHDKHFNVLKEKTFPVINVINAYEFQQILMERKK